MSTLTATPTDPTLTPTVTAVDDGNPVDAASVRPTFQSFLNYIASLRNKLAAFIDGGTITPAGNVTLSGVSLTVPTINVNDGSVIVTNAGVGGSVVQLDPAGANVFVGATTQAGNYTVGASSSNTATFKSTVDLQATTTFEKPLAFTNDGRIRLRVTAGVDTASLTYSAHFNWIRWAALTAPATATIDTDGGEGDFMIVTTDTNATPHNVTVNFPGGANVTLVQSTTVVKSALFIHDATQWLGPIAQWTSP